jgi:hypothetical protein
MMPPAEKTGHKARSMSGEVTIDGKCCTLIFQLCDRDTEQDRGEVRFWGDYTIINQIFAKIVESIGVMKTMLQKNGAFDKATAVSGGVLMLTVEDAGVGVIADETNVGLEIRSIEGPTLDFSVAPQIARRLGQKLISAAKEAEGKKGRH